jgi:hypothetical protein
MRHLYHPQAARTLNDAIGCIEDWEAQVRLLSEANQAPFWHDAMRMAIITEMMPNELQRHLEDQVFTEYDDLYREIVRKVTLQLVGHHLRDDGHSHGVVPKWGLVGLAKEAHLRLPILDAPDRVVEGARGLRMI